MYILTNKNNTTLYVGVNSDLISRINQYKTKKDLKSFTARYNLTKLVYFENFHSIEEAIDREKRLKSGNRKRKENLINSVNPDWNDLYPQILDTW